jgi:hypothetical protein
MVAVKEMLSKMPDATPLPRITTTAVTAEVPPTPVIVSPMLPTRPVTSRPPTRAKRPTKEDEGGPLDLLQDFLDVYAEVEHQSRRADKGYRGGFEVERPCRKKARNTRPRIMRIARQDTVADAARRAHVGDDLFGAVAARQVLAEHQVEDAEDGRQRDQGHGRHVHVEVREGEVRSAADQDIRRVPDQGGRAPGV